MKNLIPLEDKNDLESICEMILINEKFEELDDRLNVFLGEYFG